MPLDETNLVCFGLKEAFKKAGTIVPILKYTFVDRIPYAKKLGTCSAAIVGDIIASWM